MKAFYNNVYILYKRVLCVRILVWNKYLYIFFALFRFIYPTRSFGPSFLCVIEKRPLGGGGRNRALVIGFRLRIRSFYVVFPSRQPRVSPVLLFLLLLLCKLILSGPFKALHAYEPVLRTPFSNALAQVPTAYTFCFLFVFFSSPRLAFCKR